MLWLNHSRELSHNNTQVATTTTGSTLHCWPFNPVWCTLRQPLRGNKHCEGCLNPVLRPKLSSLFHLPALFISHNRNIIYPYGNNSSNSCMFIFSYTHNYGPFLTQSHTKIYMFYVWSTLHVEWHYAILVWNVCASSLPHTVFVMQVLYTISVIPICLLQTFWWIHTVHCDCQDYFN